MDMFNRGGEKMSEYEFWKSKEREAIALARYYERVPEDQQKAAGAREARKQAEFCRKMAEKSKDQ